MRRSVTAAAVTVGVTEPASADVVERQRRIAGAVVEAAVVPGRLARGEALGLAVGEALVATLAPAARLSLGRDAVDHALQSAGEAAREVLLLLGQRLLL